MSDLNTKANLTDLGLKMDLLWTYETPETPFEPQTVNLDLSNYNGVFIKSKRYAPYSQYYFDFFLIGTPAGRTIVPDDTPIFRTEISVRENSISFGEGYRGTNVDNSACIPYQIYGVR